MKVKKLTVITGSVLTIKHVVDEYYNLDYVHPSIQLEVLLSTLKTSEKENVTIKSSSENIISHINNIILSTEYNVEVSLYEEVKLTSEQVEVLDLDSKPCEFGAYGFEVKWMNEMLDDLFSTTIGIQEKMGV